MTKVRKALFARKWPVPEGTNLNGVRVTDLTLGPGSRSYSQRHNDIIFVTEKGLVPTGLELIRDKRPFGQVESVVPATRRDFDKETTGAVMRDLASDPTKLYLEGIDSGLEVPGRSSRKEG